MNVDPSCNDNELRLNGKELVGFLKTAASRGLSIRFRAEGTSMSPFIKDGDVVTISPLRGSPPRMGDIVAFQSPSTGNLLIHRTVGKLRNLYVMQGDNVPAADDAVPETAILGSVTKIERCGKGVSIGLGPERFLIALLSQKGVLSSRLRPLWRSIRTSMRRHKIK